MSFGFGIGDFLTAFTLAGKVRQKWVDAPKETENLENVLRGIGDLGKRVKLKPEHEADLRLACEKCQISLDQCEKLIDKHSAIQNDSSHPSKLRRAWQRVKLDPDDVRHLRDQLSSQLHQLNTIQLAIDSDLVCVVHERVEDLQQSEIQWKRAQVSGWYSPASFAEQQTDLLSRRHPATGTWFLDHPQYCHWRDNVGSTLLCPGNPGVGKSLMVAMVVDDLFTRFESQNDVLVVYLYCNFKRQSVQTLNHCLAALVRQLFQEQARLPRRVEDLYLRHRDRGTRPSTDELKSVLHSLVCDYQRTFVVIDALDECGDAYDQLSDELFMLQGRDGSNVSILATTRHIPRITNRFSTCPQLEIRANNDDIERYLDSNMSTLSSFVLRDPGLQNTIKRQIIDAADGMFLLARLHFDSLRDKTNARSLQIALSKFKKGSDALRIAYADALDRIDQQPDGHRELAWRTLMWITYAARELSIQELREAVVIEPGLRAINHDTDLDGEHDIVSVCAGLVVVDPESRVIRLVHYTTQEYLETVGSQRLPGGHAWITQSCLIYLSMNVFRIPFDIWSQQSVNPLGTHEFYGYASFYWYFHAKHTDDLHTKRQVLGFLDRAYHFPSRLSLSCNICFPPTIQTLIILNLFPRLEADTKTLKRVYAEEAQRIDRIIATEEQHGVDTRHEWESIVAALDEYHDVRISLAVSIALELSERARLLSSSAFVLPLTPEGLPQRPRLNLVAAQQQPDAVLSLVENKEWCPQCKMERRGDDYAVYDLTAQCPERTQFIHGCGSRVSRYWMY